MQNMKLSNDELIDMLFAYFGGDEKKKFVYKRFLGKKNEGWLNERINYLIDNWRPEYGEKIPSIAEINGNDGKNTAEVELAWQEFKRTYDSRARFEVIPDWVFTMLGLLGGYSLVDEKICDDETWVKKEFVRIYPALKSGNIPMKEDPMKGAYYQVGGATIMVPEKVDVNRLHPDVLGAIVEKKAIAAAEKMRELT